jgi:hypothetical protein
MGPSSVRVAGDWLRQKFLEAFAHDCFPLDPLILPYGGESMTSFTSLWPHKPAFGCPVPLQGSRLPVIPFFDSQNGTCRASADLTQRDQVWNLRLGMWCVSRQLMSGFLVLIIDLVSFRHQACKKALQACSVMNEYHFSTFPHSLVDLAQRSQ